MNASSETLASRLAGLTLIAFLVLLPLVSAVVHLLLGSSQTVPFYQLRIIVPEIFFSAMVLSDRRIGLPRIDALPMLVRVLALFWLVWSGYAVAMSGVFAVALARQIEWIGHGLFGYSLCAFLIAHPEWREKLLSYIVAGFLLYAALNSTVLALVAPPDYPWRDGMLGIGNIRHFGYYNAVALVAAHLPLMKRDRPAQKDPVAILVLTVIWGFLCWSGSRGSILAVLGALALMTIFKLVPNVRRVWATTAIAATVGGVLSIPFTPANPYFGAFRMFWTAADAENVNQFSAGRIAIWRDALERILHHPWFGIGPDQFAVIGDKPIYWINHPHDLVVQAALAWGIPGAIIFLAGLAYLLVKGVAVAQESTSGHDVTAAWILLMLSLHALVDGTLYHRSPVALFAMATAMILSSARQAQPEASKRTRAATWALTGLTTAGAVLIAASFWAFWSPGAPAPASTRAALARAFPVPLATIEGGQIMDRWAEEWHRTGHVKAATDLALWTGRHGRTPWTSLALVADWMIEDGDKKTGYAFRQQSELLQPENWDAPALNFLEITPSDGR